ncbi:MAG: AraC family transcriptional regulator [Firmicutes bacterium]|nr:AraC family transcriptional regulator [Bacillota bacterium]
MKNYEQYTSSDHKIYHQSDTNLCFGEHFHTNFEFVHCYEGELCIGCDGRLHTLHPGQNLLILPYETHSFVTHKASKSYLCVFSADFVPDVYGKLQNAKWNLRLVDPIFEEITSLEIENFQTSLCEYFQKAFLYKLCSLAFQKGLESTTSTNLAIDKNLLQYIAQNYHQDLQIKLLAETFGYNEKYITHFFHNNFDCSFSVYLNNIRLSYAQKFLQETTQTVTQITHQCGFGSIRNFNRHFFGKFNQTPTDYRKSLSAHAKHS